ncbi:ATP synthase subunit B family protein [Pseudomonas retamae]|uniref:Uncharacterized protein n=1 Tax=Pseudomonas retamae TaxID=702110 RepID=A0ABW7DAQ9_9PSED
MPSKTPTRSTVSVDIHTRPNSTPQGPTPNPGGTPRFTPGVESRTGQTGRTLADSDLDAIHPAPAPAIKVQPGPPLTETRASSLEPIDHYRLAASDALPAADASGLRTHKGRRYADMADGGIVLVGLDAESGLLRAGLASERSASGPVLLRDAESGLWHAADEGEMTSLPLTEAGLRNWRTELDFSTGQPDSDGLFSHDGKRYVVVHDHAYQALLDTQASTPAQKVWRIVKAGDPVAADTENVYHASRSGESRAITRNAQNAWVLVSPGLTGGMRRRDMAQVNRELLMQRYVPFAATHRELVDSARRYDSLWSEARAQAEDSPGRTAALIAVEVHLLKHIKKQTDFIQSLVDNKDWIIHMKAGGMYKEELHTFRLDRVRYLNRLMAVMDFRIAPLFAKTSAENCKKMITHLNKKLKLIEDRQGVMEQVRKASPGAEPTLIELSQEVPSAERINLNKLVLYVHLFADTPDHSPNAIMPSLASIDLVTGELKNIPERSHPLALMLTLDQIRSDRSRFESQLSTEGEKAEYARQIIALVDPIETRIDARLNELFATFDRHTELPSLDQDIDFSFLPPRPSDNVTTAPPATRKVFRTRRHGTSRILIGDTETATDGSIVIKVANPLQPDGPAERYEQRHGEWLPVRPPLAVTPKPQLIAEANRLLAEVEAHIAEAKAREAQKDNPTNIVEDLGKPSEKLKEQARHLQNLEKAQEDAEVKVLIERLQSAAETLSAQGQAVLVRMYKNKDVLDIMRLNWLIDHAELKALKTVDRKQLGKGRDKSFLDVYSIRDSASGAPLWEAHFHYEKQSSEALNFTIRGSHLKTLEQSKRGSESQRRDEQAGLPHVAIWRQTFDSKTAKRIFALASEAAAATR